MIFFISFSYTFLFLWQTTTCSLCASYNTDLIFIFLPPWQIWLRFVPESFFITLVLPPQISFLFQIPLFTSFYSLPWHISIPLMFQLTFHFHSSTHCRLHFICCLVHEFTSYILCAVPITVSISFPTFFADFISPAALIAHFILFWSFCHILYFLGSYYISFAALTSMFISFETSTKNFISFITAMADVAKIHVLCTYFNLITTPTTNTPHTDHPHPNKNDALGFASQIA